MSTDNLIFNGLNGASGDYLLPAMTPRQVSEIVQGEPQDEGHLRELKWWYQRLTRAHLGPREGVDPKNLADSGWGVIFAHEPAAKHACGLRFVFTFPTTHFGLLLC